MKRLFNEFMKEFRVKVMTTPSYYRAEKASTLFNRWMVATMNHPTEFANAFMVRKWLNKLTA